MDPRCGNPKAENLRRKSWRSSKRITSARFWMPIVARREPPALSVAMIVSSRLFFMIAACPSLPSKTLLAASRRIFRSPDAVPLQPIRSLYYLLPVIDEVLQLRISQDYFRYLQLHIDRLQKKNITS